MNKQALAMLIPIMALAIPVAAIIMGSLVKIAKFKAEGQRAGLPPDADARMAALEDDVHALRRELSETQERLDFTERLLAQRSEEQPRLK
ncbi:MAG: hypothetical protein SFV24_00220 [Gemmatimonadales bacterium]|nr:hypothetical protein [Gemmatimonadales bacterium]